MANGIFYLKKEKAGSETPPEVFNWRLACLVVIASCGGVIFGYDLSFVSGVFSQPAFLKRFHLANSTEATHLQTNVVATCECL